MEASNTRVLLTGASGGIGKCIVSNLIESGASVLLHSRSLTQLEAYAEQASLPESRFQLIEGELTDQADLARIASEAKDFGINTLINNAGINAFEPFEASDIQSIVNVNVIATMQLTQSLLPHFQTLPEAIIFNIGSTFGSIGFAGYVTYSATKHAIKGFSEALRRELADSNIRVLYISPRATATKMNGANVNEVNIEMNVHTDSPELVAREVIDSLRRSLTTKQLGWPEKLQVKLNALFPEIVDAALKKQLHIIKKHISTNLTQKKPTQHE
jgi:short-subunit dehydrogenase